MDTPELLIARRYRNLPGDRPHQPREKSIKEERHYKGILWVTTKSLADILKKYPPHEIEFETKVPLRSLYRIMHEETVLTHFFLADKILSRMGLQHKIHDGSLEIIDG